MARLIVEGGRRLVGEFKMYSAKNAVLPLLAATVLTDEKCVLKDCPDILDVTNMLKILEGLGCKCDFTDGDISVDSLSATNHEIPNSLASKLRSSVFLMGSVLGRFKKAVVAYPGGCDIGLRPINLHIEGLRALNVKISEENGYIYCDGSNMRGNEISLDFPSVGTTENLMMAASVANGVTIIKNAAREPEIVDLQNMLNAMGARIRGAGRNAIEIIGVKKLHGAVHKPIPDRIVAGTFLTAAAISGGEIELNNVNPEHISSLISKLKESTCKIHITNDKIYLQAAEKLKSIRNVQTSPYPGFPTDLQAQITALECVSDGVSIIEENMFETRFKHVTELTKMGADITIRGRAAIINGVNRLRGATVRCFDLRGGAAMVMAGLRAEGTTVILEAEHIDRGYRAIEKDLTALGAVITREEGQ